MKKEYRSVKVDPKIRELVEQKESYIYEMTSWESGFLMGLLNEKKPQKILEVGVAEGGTSVLIKKQLEKNNQLDYHMYSVDLNYNLYRDQEKITGYQFIDACHKNIISNSHHQFMLGQYLPEIIDDIGNDIDFVILDTVHAAPGELLDLLVVLPYMKEGGVVCFHDMALDHNAICTSNSYINKLLFDVASSEAKYLNISGQADNDRAMGFPNIGAFEVDETTWDHIYDLFSCFSFPWQYMPDDSELELYEKKYLELYSEEEVRFFRWALSLNKNTMAMGKCEKEKPYKIMGSKDVYLYGTGTRGKKIYAYLKSLGINIVGFLVSDGQKKSDRLFDINVIQLSEYDGNENDVVIVGTTFRQVLQELEKRCIPYYDPSDCFMRQVNDYNAIRELLC